MDKNTSSIQALLHKAKRYIILLCAVLLLGLLLPACAPATDTTNTPDDTTSDEPKVFTPKNVIMIVGVNKIVPNLDTAIRRVKTIAAPLNTKRLNCDTYCRSTGVCMGVDGEMTDGCHGPGRICCNYLVSAQQRVENRIHVILVGEPLGF